MTKKINNKAPLSGLMAGARKAKDEKEAEQKQLKASMSDAKKEASKTPPGDITRERFSVYADKATFERVKAWATFLKMNQADIIERAINLYADRLGEEYNDGKDPLTLKEAPTELP